MWHVAYFLFWETILFVVINGIISFNLNWVSVVQSLFKVLMKIKIVNDKGRLQKKKTVNLMTSRLKVGGGLVQNIISKSILIMTTQGGGVRV